MELRTISPDVTVSPQIAPADVPAIAARGFGSIICNRPDGEAVDQPDFDAIATAAKQAGMEARYLPVVSGQVRDADADDFGAALTELPGPVLAYCRSGTRSSILWALSQGGKQPVDAILTATANAGYDLSSMAPRLVDASRSGDASRR